MPDRATNSGDHAVASAAPLIGAGEFCFLEADGRSFPSLRRCWVMIQPETLYLSPAPPYPNSRLPVLIYRAALPADATEMEQSFAVSGWCNSWRNGIYRFHHFHSIAHEVLGIAAGRVNVRFGGPTGREAVLTAGDVVVIPSGVAHFNGGDDGSLLVVGAYPGGARFDTLRGNAGEYVDAAKRAAALPIPECDPVPGSASLQQIWAV